jgi:hypothetical protein
MEGTTIGQNSASIHENNMLIAMDELSIQYADKSTRTNVIRRLELQYKIKVEHIRQNKYNWITVLRGSKMNET